MQNEHSQEEQKCIEMAYETARAFARKKSVRLSAHLDNACTRVAAKSGNDLTAKALILDELYNGLVSSRELLVGNELTVISPARTVDGLDTAYWVGLILSLTQNGRVDAELSTLCEQSWVAHSRFVERIGQARWPHSLFSE